ncbi:hypothetical protein V8F20_009551 [Naviculisporaceae sp. PSN 640]
MATNNILVVGATGQQGGSVIKALLALPPQNPPIHILALTRNTQSSKAQALLSSAPKDTLELVQGDSTDPNPTFSSRPAGSITSLFVVTVPGGKTTEESQAIPLIDTAASHGVKHIVFSSVDRGGDDKSWTNPTNIPHFKSKHNIEIHLRDKAAKDDANFTWTILRPVAFLDNMNPGFFCSMFTAMWQRALAPTTKLQFISVRDIGIFAAKALTEPEKWKGKAFALAGDSLTLDEAKANFKSVTGKDLPQTFGFLGGALLWAVSDVGLMFEFFEKEGYGADIEARRKDVPDLQDFETWLKESSKWKDAELLHVTGNIIGPQTFQDRDKPDYYPAKIAVLATQAACIWTTFALFRYYVWQNKRRAQAGLSEATEDDFLSRDTWEDKTDRENKRFKYVY